MGCRVFRVGVFFDGTGNNRFIDANAGDGSASNVAKLYALYQEHNGEVLVRGYAKPLYTARIYKEGIGTQTKQVPVSHNSRGRPSRETKRVKERRFF